MRVLGRGGVRGGRAGLGVVRRLAACLLAGSAVFLGTFAVGVAVGGSTAALASVCTTSGGLETCPMETADPEGNYGNCAVREVFLPAGTGDPVGQITAFYELWCNVGFDPSDTYGNACIAAPFLSSSYGCVPFAWNSGTYEGHTYYTLFGVIGAPLDPYGDPSCSDHNDGAGNDCNGSATVGLRFQGGCGCTLLDGHAEMWEPGLTQGASPEANLMSACENWSVNEGTIYSMPTNDVGLMYKATFDSSGVCTGGTYTAELPEFELCTSTSEYYCYPLGVDETACNDDMALATTGGCDETYLTTSEAYDGCEAWGSLSSDDCTVDYSSDYGSTDEDLSSSLYWPGVSGSGPYWSDLSGMALGVPPGIVWGYEAPGLPPAPNAPGVNCVLSVTGHGVKTANESGGFDEEFDFALDTPDVSGYSLDPADAELLDVEGDVSPEDERASSDGEVFDFSQVFHSQDQGDAGFTVTGEVTLLGGTEYEADTCSTSLQLAEVPVTCTGDGCDGATGGGVGAGDCGLPPPPVNDCSLDDLGGCLEAAGVWAFYPDSAVADAWCGFVSAYSTRVPFAYIGGMNSYVAGVVSDAQTASDDSADCAGVGGGSVAGVSVPAVQFCSGGLSFNGSPPPDSSTFDDVAEWFRDGLEVLIGFGAAMFLYRMVTRVLEAH